MQAGRIECALPIRRVEAKEAQDAQVVFRNALRRFADEAHAPRCDVGEPADVVVHETVARDRERVDGKVAALGVRLPITAERNLGLAAKGFNVLAQRCDFIWAGFDHDGDGAVLDAGRHRLEARSFHPTDHRFG